MELENINELVQMDLFLGIEPKQLLSLLNCVQAKKENYSKGDFIISEGDTIYNFGVILSGNARSLKWYGENQPTIVTLLKKGSEIGVLIAASFENISPVSVQAQSEVCILSIPYSQIMSRCKKDCQGHDRLLHNYINIVAQKGLVLHERISCLLKPSVREKILSYLIRTSNKKTNITFILPLNRNEMAEYLNVERSALSRELSSMKKEGLIDYHRNHFKVLSLSDSI